MINTALQITASTPVLGRVIPAFLLLLAAVAPCMAEPADIANGWRGNGIGMWPDARPPLEWWRSPKGVAGELRTRLDRPGEKAEIDSAPLARGIVRNWLVIGPFPVNDSVKDFGDAQIGDETKVEPTTGDKSSGQVWQKLASEIDDPFAFGPADLPWTKLGPAIGGFKRNQMAYLHAYIYAPNGGAVRVVAEHAHGMKAWLNGKEVDSKPDRGDGMGNYYSFSRVELSIYDLGIAPHFDLELKKGWNRLLLKLSTFNKEGWTEHHLCLRLMDLPSVEYDAKNILWMTELPHRSNATPIIVGNRLFVMAEPDELLCLDKNSGKILWTAANNYYEMLTPEERDKLPALVTKVDPLVKELKTEKDFIKRQRLRTQIQRALAEIDADRFKWKADGHFEGHFGIVGFTTPTPVSDGKRVWVWCGNGVAACYDLDGKRKWITRVEAKELSYSSSPGLADGTLAVFQHKLVGLDAETGKVRWEQDKIRINNGAVLAARIAGTLVFVTQRGFVVRARDGVILDGDLDQPTGDTGWAPPAILGDIVYQPRYGVNHINVLDYAGARGDAWEAKQTRIEVTPPLAPVGKRVDRWTAGSPLVFDGLLYQVDIYGTLYVVDLKAKKLLYTKDTGLRGLFHYNALPVAASATLVGKHIIVEDNQGTALVLEPGREYKEVARNHIATQMDRYWPIPAQETIGYSPPVADGQRLYIRGERFLYCIGEK